MNRVTGPLLQAQRFSDLAAPALVRPRGAGVLACPAAVVPLSPKHADSPYRLRARDARRTMAGFTVAPRAPAARIGIDTYDPAALAPWRVRQSGRVSCREGELAI